MHAPTNDTGRLAFIMRSSMHRFDAIFIINLPHRTDRLADVAEELNRVGLDIASPPVRVFAAKRPDDAGGFPSIGCRGCYLSHLEVLRTARNEGLERILVLEDDAEFVPEFETRAKEVLDALERQDWALFYGGYASRSPAPAGQGLIEVPASFPMRLSHCIAYRKTALDDLIGHLEAVNTFRRTHPQHRTFVVEPHLADQRRSRTDIHQVPWFDRIPVIREATEFARRIANHARRRLRRRS
jgi:hypothetical protein